MFTGLKQLIAFTAIVAYDTVLTFPREVKNIWTRKPSLVSLVYFTQRYPNLIVYAFLTANNNFPFSDDTVSDISTRCGRIAHCQLEVCIALYLLA